MERLHRLLISLYLLILAINLTTTTAQSPAPAPAPPGPTNVIKILKKAGHFKTFIRLLKSTQLDSNLNSQLGNTNNGLTIFAPSDSAFSALKTGTVHSLTDQEKVELMQFHIVPMFISSSQFDTVSSPLKTHAGSGARKPSKARCLKLLLVVKKVGITSTSSLIYSKSLCLVLSFVV
ncbi:hypothetical protein POTOM_002472 [Populus tomentosa]|uniref:FAS1 domain-containing protein n=1 Tax=Populus tomentosa TaxID=118781 RepID=A0A8X8DJT1_POPTO|nr:hypothetical protein POTOM_002472 [Populus tomentosa]